MPLRVLICAALLFFCMNGAAGAWCKVPDKVTVKQNPDSPVQIKGYFATMTANMLDVEFVNTATKSAKEVIWEVRVGDGAAFIRDQGDFQPGVLVNHCGMKYGLHQGNFIWRQQAGVRVVRVVYDDGTKWETPDAPPEEDDF